MIGAGIGGLTTAIALRQRGIDAHVYESAPSIRSAGAGLMVSPNAMQVLRRLGIAEQVIAAGLPLERAEIHDARSGLLQSIDLADAHRRFGEPTVAIHRRRLHEILLAEIPVSRVHLGAACESILVEDGWPVVRFTNGRAIMLDLIIGADGQRSAVREFVAPGHALRYSGQTSYRAIASLDLPPEFAGTSREIWSAHCRFGYAAVAPGEVYWFVAADAPAGESRTPMENANELRAMLAAFPKPVNLLLDATAPADILRTDMYDLVPFDGWSRDRVVLLGDAAHASTPNLGQGRRASNRRCARARRSARHPHARLGRVEVIRVHSPAEDALHHRALPADRTCRSRRQPRRPRDEKSRGALHAGLCRSAPNGSPLCHQLLSAPCSAGRCAFSAVSSV